MTRNALLPCAGLLAPLLAPLPTHADDAGIRIDAPNAGWRTGSGDNTGFLQEVNYPASSVHSDPNQPDSARIRGRIHATPKPDAGPATLVVNGVPMPLSLEEDGSFDRPYVFPAGSNSLAVLSPNRDQARRIQFYQQGRNGVPAKLRLLLSWDTDNTDLDLHLITPDGAHIYYGDRVAPNGTALDVDVTTGYGPEIIASPTPLRGRYLVYVNYYGGGGMDEDDAPQKLTTAQVTLIREEGTPDEQQETLAVPMRAAGELTLVKSFSY